MNPAPCYRVLPDAILNKLEPQLIVPAVLVHVPEKVCTQTKFKVPPVPLIVNPPPFTLPVNVAVQLFSTYLQFL
jgi:hypothetical protein